MSTNDEQKKLAIKGGTLIDGTGRPPILNAVIIVKGGKIMDVGEDLYVPRDAEVIDAEGKTVMPGLIDAHVHLSGSRTVVPLHEMLVTDELRLLRATVDARKLLEAGFTAVRDCGGKNTPSLKKAIEEGTIFGPRIMAAGKIISQTFGHADAHYLPYDWAKDHRIMGSILADGADECRKAVRMVLREGADLIKICTTGGVFSEKDEPEYPQFTVEEIRAITDEAHRAGRMVAAHAEGNIGIGNAIEGGVDTIEHGDYIDDEQIEIMKKKNLILVPTMAIDDAMIKNGEKAGIAKWAMRKIRECVRDNIKNYVKAYKAGVKMAIGTDYGGPSIFPMGENAVELRFRVEKIGVSEMDAIVSATKIGAEALGLGDKIGTIQKGKLADIIVVDGDPTKDIRVLQETDKIKMVMKEGEVAVNRGLLRA